MFAHLITIIRLLLPLLVIDMVWIRLVVMKSSPIIPWANIIFLVGDRLVFFKGTIQILNIFVSILLVRNICVILIIYQIKTFIVHYSHLILLQILSIHIIFPTVLGSLVPGVRVFRFNVAWANSSHRWELLIRRLYYLACFVPFNMLHHVIISVGVWAQTVARYHILSISMVFINIFILSRYNFLLFEHFAMRHIGGLPGSIWVILNHIHCVMNTDCGHLVGVADSTPRRQLLMTREFVLTQV